jgi:hypothetical protein
VGDSLDSLAVQLLVIALLVHVNFPMNPGSRRDLPGFAVGLAYSFARFGSRPKSENSQKFVRTDKPTLTG